MEDPYVPDVSLSSRYSNDLLFPQDSYGDAAPDLSTLTPGPTYTSPTFRHTVEGEWRKDMHGNSPNQSSGS
jgi:hypothetical protein